MKSEFPETKLSKFGRRFGWIFSPLLFILLLAYTLLTAQNLTIDPFSGDISKFGNVHLKELSDSDVYFDQELVGRTSSVLKTTKVSQNQSLQITVKQNNKRDWNKTVNPREGYVSILYPIVYPREVEFNEESFNAVAIYRSQVSNTFFYEKVENNNIFLYRYDVQRLLFTINISNQRVADITSLVKKADFDISVLNQTNILTGLKERKIFPGTLGRKSAIIVPNERIYIVQDNGTITQVPNYIPKSNDTIHWSPNDEYLIIGNTREILSVNVNTNSVNVVKRANDSEQLETQFTFENGVVYKVISTTSIDLRENNYIGNNQLTIEIPNVDGLRRNNLSKAYDLIEKQNSILIQSSKNIYLFNLANFELKKFNKFEGEEIINVSPEWEVVITRNSQAKNQFRYYNLDTNDSRTFTFAEIEPTQALKEILEFNYSQNLAFNYDGKVLITDADGANKVEYNSSSDPKIALMVKEDRSVLLAITETNTDSDRLQNLLKIKIERFEN